jgi:serpin B
MMPESRPSHRIVYLIFLSPFLSPCACTGTETDNPALPENVDFVRSEKAYLSSVEVPPPDLQALQNGNHAFTLDLYRQLAADAGDDENLFFSPYSVSTIMAMTRAGAEGDTARQIDEALHFDLPQEALHPAMNGLSRHLDQVGNEGDMRLSTVNATWMQRGYPIEASYLDTLSQHYDNGVYQVDFEGDPDATRRTINEWVGEQTDDLVDELLPEGSVGSNTALVLANTIYFSGLWEDEFDEERTEPAPFTLLDGNQVSVPMMSRNHGYLFAITPDYRAAELSYRGSSLGMIFIQPNPGEFAEFEAELDGERLEEIIDEVVGDWKPGDERPSLWLQVPRFSFDADADLKTALQGLGVADAFTEDADLSGISSEPPPLYVDAAHHKAHVAIDEKGTVAAAASGEVLVPLSVSPHIRLDRPFIFFIRDHDTGTVLFIGRLIRPDGPVTGRADAPPPDTEVICDILDQCEDRALTRQQCIDALDADDPAVVEQCADCYQAEYDLAAGDPWSFCLEPVCTGVCPDHVF